MQEIEQKIVEYLKEKYNPLGIILHGSRARGDAGKNSDWDLLVLVTDDFEQVSYGGEIDGQVIDPKIVKAPIMEAFFKKHNYLIPALAGGKILFDVNENALSTINFAKKLDDKGMDLSSLEIENRRQFMLRSLGRLTDSLENIELFNYRIGNDFASRAIDWWFMVLNNKWSESARIALETIKKDDPEYFSWIEIILGNKDSQSKLVACENVYKKLFLRS